jgi:hypothetical protein
MPETTYTFSELMTNLRSAQEPAEGTVLDEASMAWTVCAMLGIPASTPEEINSAYDLLESQLFAVGL